MISGLSGSPGLMTVSDSRGSNDSAASSDSVSSAQTLTYNETGTEQQSLYEAGSYAGGSFSFSSVVFSSTATDSITTQASDTMSANDNSSDTGSHWGVQTGADAGDSGSGQDSFSDSSLGTASGSDSQTESSVQTEVVYEAGSYSGSSFSLSSYSLLEQGSDTITISHNRADSRSDSGSNSSAAVLVDGATEYLGSGSFSNSDSSAETFAETLTSAFTLSEQGTFANGNFNLSSYVFSEEQTFSESVSKTDSATESFSGTNQGAGYSGSGSDNSSEQGVRSSCGSLTEEGVYANGSFALGTVTYEASGSESVSASDSGSDNWTGTYSGSDNYSGQWAANDSYSVFASGSFSSGSFSLASYSLSGSSSGSYTDSSSVSQTLSGAASSWANTASGQESDTLWQSGATSGGAFSNASYNYADASSGTTTAQAQGSGFLNSDTWTNTASTQETGSGTSGTVAQAGVSTYSWNEGSGSQNASSSASGSPSATLPGASVAFVAPDGTTVPVAGAAMANGDGSMVDESAGMDLGNVPSDLEAPVSASPDLSVVTTTADWLTSEDQLARQAVDQGAANTGNQAAAAQSSGGSTEALRSAMSRSHPRPSSSTMATYSTTTTNNSTPKASSGGASNRDDLTFDYSNDPLRGSFTGDGIFALPIRDSGGDVLAQMDDQFQRRARAEAEGRPVPPLTAGDVPLYGLDGNSTAAGAMVQAGQLIAKMNFTVAASLVAAAGVFPVIAIEGASIFVVGNAAVDAYYNAQAASSTFNSAVDGDKQGVVTGLASFGAPPALKGAGKLLGKGAKAFGKVVAPKPPKFSFNAAGKASKSGGAGKWSALAAAAMEKGNSLGARAAKTAPKTGRTGKIAKAVGKINIHHIVSRYLNGARGWRRNWTALAQALLQGARVGLKTAINKVPLIGHKGPHPELYHKRVYQRLLNAVRGLRGAARTKAAMDELTQIAKNLIADITKLSGNGL
jgi:hypothetical protein